MAHINSTTKNVILDKIKEYAKSAAKNRLEGRIQEAIVLEVANDQLIFFMEQHGYADEATEYEEKGQEEAMDEWHQVKGNVSTIR